MVEPVMYCPFDDHQTMPAGFPCTKEGQFHTIEIGVVVRWLARSKVGEVECTCETFGYCAACA